MGDDQKHTGENDDVAVAWREPTDDDGYDVDPESYFSDETSTLGDRIAAARQAAGLTQAGLATRLGVGVKVVSSWENDRSEPRANRLAMLAGLLNVSVTWLLTGGGEGVDPPETALSNATSPHRLSIMAKVEDLAAAQRFFGDALGCAIQTQTERSIDFDFFGHTLSSTFDDVGSSDGAAKPAFTLGVVVPRATWDALVDRLRAHGVDFVMEPSLLRLGATDEEGLMAVADQSGNVFEFRGRANL